MRVNARVEDGWIRIPYDGPELSRVEIAVGEVEPIVWRSAYLNTVGDERVAQIRPTGFGLTETMKVWIRVDGMATLIGQLGQELPNNIVRRRRG